jgi:type I restriction enzyme S subunit
VTIVRPTEGKFYPDFFGYALIAIEDQIRQGGEGCGGQTELSRSKLANDYLVSYPKNLEEQRRIVTILDEVFEGIDTAIANADKNLANAREMFDATLLAAVHHPRAGWSKKTLREVSIDFGRGKSKHRPRGDAKLLGGNYPLIQTGDVANSIVGANVAETAILDFDSCFPDSVIGVVADDRFADNEYIEFLLQTFKATLKDRGKGTARDNINLGTFENQKFPFPSIEEQRRIVADIKILADQIRMIETIYRQKLSKLAELKQAILRKAFAGQLTGQPEKTLRRAAE